MYTAQENNMAKEKVLVVVVELKPGETAEAATKEVERLLATRKSPPERYISEDQSWTRHRSWYDVVCQSEDWEID